MAAEGVWGSGLLLSPAVMLTVATELRKKGGVRRLKGCQEEWPISASLCVCVEGGIPEIRSSVLGMSVSRD